MTPDESFRAFSYQAPFFNTDYHQHPELELTLITQGNGHRLIGDHLESISHGELILIGRDLPHRYWGQPATMPSEAFVVQFRTEIFESLLPLPEFHSVRRLIQRSHRGLRIREDIAFQLAPTLRELCDLRGPQRLASLLQILAELSGPRKSKPLASTHYEAPQET